MPTEVKTEKPNLKDQLIAAGAISGPTEQQKREARIHFEAEMPEAKMKTLPLSALFESEQNLRKVFEGIDELAKSMENGVGVLVPLMVRPVGKRFEIIAGARRYRAAGKAKLKEVPVDVRPLSDVQVSEVMLVENSQRQGLHPMEEAEGYDRLEREHHYSRIQIAEKVGKSTGTIHARLKLLALGPEARKAFRDEKFDATVAVPLARIRDHRLQAKAIPTIEKMSTREAIDWLQNQYTQTLKGAPFDLNDAGLLPAAGSCKKCPDRSGSTPGLFEDLKGHDTCTNPPCFEKKVNAAWKLASASAEEKGMQVLTLAKGKQIFGTKDEPSGGYVLANKPCAADPKKRTWKQLVATVTGDPASGEITRYFIPDAKLRGRECFREEEVLKRIDVGWAKKELDEPTTARPAAPGAYDEARLAMLTRKAVVNDFIAATSTAAPDALEEWLPQLRIMAINAHRNGNARDADDRRNLADTSAEKWISEEADKPALLRYLYEVALLEFLGGVYQGYSEDFTLLAKRANYDVDSAEKRIGQVVAAEAVVGGVKKMSDDPTPAADEPRTEPAPAATDDF